MLVLRTLPAPDADIWYLAYGSNLSTKKFIHDRGINPISSVSVTVLGWTLSMDSAGVPYSEPAFASILPIHTSGSEKVVQLIGTAYQLSPEMYKKVLASEGGGIAYTEVEVQAEVLKDDEDSARSLLGKLAVRSLVTVLQRKARPSVRYMALLRTGAAEADMPLSYQRFLAAFPVFRPSERLVPKIGASLFLAFWIPIMMVMERITKASLRKTDTGNAPMWVISLVRLVVFVMWGYHDFIHAPIWGRGDGYGVKFSRLPNLTSMLFYTFKPGTKATVLEAFVCKFYDSPADALNYRFYERKNIDTITPAIEAGLLDPAHPLLPLLKVWGSLYDDNAEQSCDFCANKGLVKCWPYFGSLKPTEEILETSGIPSTITQHKGLLQSRMIVKGLGPGKDSLCLLHVGAPMLTDVTCRTAAFSACIIRQPTIQK
ncbi:hypothetical protein Daus18300_014199 [Diaporthe australafricana]|uniref:gamma-glutamylcyclotransferase n=1 Tax=Diaporthe australafricana TaxID=127596 RepID=A0ABR3VW47_9PEZI